MIDHGDPSTETLIPVTLSGVPNRCERFTAGSRCCPRDKAIAQFAVDVATSDDRRETKCTAVCLLSSTACTPEGFSEGVINEASEGTEKPVMEKEDIVR